MGRSLNLLRELASKECSEHLSTHSFFVPNTFQFCSQAFITGWGGMCQFLSIQGLSLDFARSGFELTSGDQTALWGRFDNRKGCSSCMLGDLL